MRAIRTRRFEPFPTVCLLLLASAVAVPAAALPPTPDEARLRAAFDELDRTRPDVMVSNGAGGMQPAIRCGTPTPSAEWRAAVEESLALTRELFPEPEARARTFDVAFHIIRKANGEGDMPDEMVQAQIDVLNEAYDAANFTFNLASIDRKTKKKWFNKCDREGPFIKMTNNRAIDPAHTINIYSCGPPGGLLGFSFLPGTFPEDSVFNAIVLHWATLPGGYYTPFDEGDTGTHESGHFLGLYHTFTPWESTGNGCLAPGDEVADTPYEQYPAPWDECAVGRDTCPQAGNDPVRNYMDYSGDPCINKFTAKQRRRMNEMIDLFRPSLSQ